MERRGEKGAAAGRARRPQGGAEQPSFSSTLLDAIYKSMDEPGHGADAASKKKQQDQEAGLHYSYYYRPSLAGSYRGRAPAAATTTSSSSDCSSYGGFSSSEAETSSGRHQHRRLRPIRTAAAPAPPAPEKKAKPSKKQQQAAPGASIRAKLRDLRKAPASPGARLAGFLNTIFAGGKRAPQTPPSASMAAEYACSTASSASCSRSCLSKTPSTRGGGGQQAAGRTVRFVDSAEAAAAPAAAVPGRRMPARAVEQMLLRRMEMESDEEEEDEESSDASSDLFELESFTAAAPPGAAGYRDELPVYETTRVVLSRGAIGGHGFGHGRSARVV